MRRLVKYKEIADSATYLKEQIEKIETYKTKLYNDIKLIDNDYKGKDATNIINAYTSELQLLEEYIYNIKAYELFFEKMSSRYRDVHEKAEKDINYEKEILDEESKKIAETFGAVIVDEIEVL